MVPRMTTKPTDWVNHWATLHSSARVAQNRQERVIQFVFGKGSKLYLNWLSKWAGEPFQFTITYLPSNGVYEKDGNKQIRADGQDKTHTHTQQNFQSSEILHYTELLKFEFSSFFVHGNINYNNITAAIFHFLNKRFKHIFGHICGNSSASNLWVGVGWHPSHVAYEHWYITFLRLPRQAHIALVMYC